MIRPATHASEVRSVPVRAFRKCLTASLQAKRGFTLLEVLAAMAMVATLAGALYASLSIAFRARNSATRSLEPVRKCATAVAMLRADLQSAVGCKGLLAGPMLGESQTALAGQAGDSLEFYAAVGEPRDTGVGGDIRKIEISCEQATETGDNILYRRVTSNLLASRAVDPQEQVICRGVRNFTLRYYDGTTWYDAWDSTAVGDVLPVAVEVTVELAGPPGAPSDQAGYRMSSIVLIPCGQPVTDEATAGEATEAAAMP
jgi:type II secretion system protein J